ncbi:uncharacterized protein KNAG_0F01130 [Huiozyma naganishii CBS 8797]|uniref:Uncharacterized protein n=1 Tax=Huiozyma naganishii (strain ATCC MYA-139 / BCRC 22969 / CBS 8797 / KCTC 17520 / NBRC 10181 / NCYC 3082 / Yp74L-3) TaxID=1071383 RepID=J7S893_HUIN7|nr:hypothetical protein KNAG_0F01130 [Kazachstania naganishii CBS 8797]CCK70781.1 hypothetical protein KNAG_0F01130 [Kazachstania naganishii CBS 8797]
MVNSTGLPRQSRRRRGNNWRRKQKEKGSDADIDGGTADDDCGGSGNVGESVKRAPESLKLGTKRDRGNKLKSRNCPAPSQGKDFTFKSTPVANNQRRSCEETGRRNCEVGTQTEPAAWLQLETAFRDPRRHSFSSNGLTVVRHTGDGDVRKSSISSTNTIDSKFSTATTLWDPEYPTVSSEMDSLTMREGTNALTKWSNDDPSSYGPILAMRHSAANEIAKLHKICSKLDKSVIEYVSSTSRAKAIRDEDVEYRKLMDIAEERDHVDRDNWSHLPSCCMGTDHYNDERILHCIHPTQATPDLQNV